MSTEAQPQPAVGTARTKPYTGQEFLESLRDGREIWIYGERVKDVTTHPAFRNTSACWRGCTTHCTTSASQFFAQTPIPATAATRIISSKRRTTWMKWWRRAMRSRNGHESPTAGWAAAPITRPRFWPRWAPTRISTRRSMRTPAAGTRRSRRKSRSSITRL